MSNKKSNAEETQLQDKITLAALLLKYGFSLPQTANEVEEYNKYFGTTDVELPEKLANPSYINERFPEGNKKKSTKKDYFKKIVLAAHIVYELHSEPTFGKVKFVKLLYLCEEVCAMELSTCYGKYAAGPFDPKLLNSIHAEFKKKKWFTVKKAEYGFRYCKEQNVEEYKKYFPNYFRDSINIINEVIDLFRKRNSDFCEIVATMFFVWKENIEKQQLISNQTLINDFYNWGEKKKRFPQYQLEKAILWMKQNQIVPKY